PTELPFDDTREELVRPRAREGPPSDPVRFGHHRRTLPVPKEPVLFTEPRDHLDGALGPARIGIVGGEDVPHGLAQLVTQSPRAAVPPRRFCAALRRFHGAASLAPVNVRQLPCSATEHERRVATPGFRALKERRV